MSKSPSLEPLKKYGFKVALAPLLKLVECVIELATPFLVRYIIDEGVSKGDLPFVLKMGTVILGLSIIAFGVTLIAQCLSAKVASNYGYDLREKAYRHFETLGEAEIDNVGKSKILTLLSNDSFSMQNAVNMFMRLLLRAPFLLIGATIISFFITPWAGWVFLGAVLLSSLVLAMVMVLSPKLYASLQTGLDQISSLGSDSIKGARPIRAFGKEDYSENKFDESSASYKKKAMRIARLNAFINPLTFGLVNLGMILVVYLGGFSVQEGSLTTGQVVSLISYLTLTLQALTMFSRLIVSLNRAKASKRRLDSFFGIKASITNGSYKATSVPNVSSEMVSFKDVSFSYSKGKAALSHVSFSLNYGETMGIIGGTGSGKSTLISLIERLYEASEGTIFFKGEPIKDYDLEALRSEIALVSQKPAIFKGTIKSNLLLGNSKASDEECLEALKKSLAYEFVNRYSDKMNHEVEEGGANLSGGQKQRLLLARAILQNASLLILDDSLSALDFLSEKKVRENLSSFPNLTKIIISQRATSLSGCDKIIVIDNGRIVNEGTHEELLRTSPIYHDIYEMQVKSR